MLESFIAPLFALAAISLPAQDELPYQKLADTFRTAHGIAELDLEQTELEPLLEAGFFSAQVGLFEVLIPREELGKKATANDFKDVCASLADAQQLWLTWLGGDVEQLQADLKSHAGWIRKWKTSVLMSVSKSEVHGALDLFDAPEEHREQCTRCSEALQLGTFLGVSREETAQITLVLMPERKEFVEMLAFAGWFLPDERASFWMPGIENWTEFRLNDLQIIALQHPATAAAPGTYDGFTSMKDNDASGLEQQVVQLGMNKFLAYMHGDVLPTGVLRGLSIQMLIEMYGTCLTRNDGDMRGRITNARSIFIAGGQSEGGRLGKNVAESRWRQDYGRYHYHKILKQVQKAGASADRKNHNRLNTFLLIGDDEKVRVAVHAPLFGPHAGADPVPDNAKGDYSELLRAYNVAFVNWLQSAAAGSSKNSILAFSKLLNSLSAGQVDADFSAILEEIYGKPLTDEKLSQDCLEGQFLKWISKS